MKKGIGLKIGNILLSILSAVLFLFACFYAVEMLVLKAKGNGLGDGLALALTVVIYFIVAGVCVLSSFVGWMLSIRAKRQNAPYKPYLWLNISMIAVLVLFSLVVVLFLR
jgi:heme/copper-type cytochrome/quinol oxidase subunit 2